MEQTNNHNAAVPDGHMLRREVLENIGRYDGEMTISQVVRFFERQGLAFTKTMIQNYVRVGVMPPPVDKRYYVKEHLILLSLIHQLKEVYSLEDIRRLFGPIAKDISTFDDDILDMAAVYGIYTELYEKAVTDSEAALPVLMNDIRVRADKRFVQSGNDREAVCRFVTILTLMAQSIAARQLVFRLLGVSEEEK